jgi:hypothetical protein
MLFLLFGEVEMLGIAKEVLESLMEVAQDLLERLTVGFLKIGVRFLVFED